MLDDADQELADAVEGVLRGEEQCGWCGKWLDPHKVNDFIGQIQAKPPICNDCWRSLEPGEVQLTPGD